MKYYYVKLKVELNVWAEGEDPMDASNKLLDSIPDLKDYCSRELNGDFYEPDGFIPDEVKRGYQSFSIASDYYAKWEKVRVYVGNKLYRFQKREEGFFLLSRTGGNSRLVPDSIIKKLDRFPAYYEGSINNGY